MALSDLKVLVVNDKVELRMVIRDYLRNEGVASISVSENGLSALRKATADPPDLILADYSLPGLTGVELLREIRNHRDLAETPFILISSEAEQKFVAHAAELGVSAYVVKPFSHQTLADKIRMVLKKRINPGDADKHYLEANLLARSGDLSLALEKYQEALEATQSAMAVIYNKMGGLRERLEELGLAETDYLDAIGMSDLYVDAYDSLGNLHLRQDRPEEALKHLEKSVDISPLNARRQHSLGQALLGTGDFEAAEKAFKHALELDPSQTHIYNQLGISLRRQKKLNEAKAHLEKALEVEDGDENLYYNLSRVFLDEGDRESAMANLTRALELHPGFKEAEELLNRLRGN